MPSQHQTYVIALVEFGRIIEIGSDQPPAAAAAELLRRRREALTERVATGLEEGALRLKGCRYDELDEGLQGLVAQQVMETLTESEVENLVAINGADNLAIKRGK